MSDHPKSITVDVPVTTVYNQWTQFEDFPQFMEGVESVTQLDDRRLHWVAEIAGTRREWDAVLRVLLRGSDLTPCGLRVGDDLLLHLPHRLATVRPPGQLVAF